jgi:hypothetical protein
MSRASTVLTPIEKITEDILSIIFSHLEIHDLAAFQQASWTTYHQADSDVLWHQLLHTYHLPISVSLEEALRLPIPTLRKLLNRAYRLERNLRSSKPRLREVANVSQPADSTQRFRPQSCLSTQNDHLLIFTHDSDDISYLGIKRIDDSDGYVQPESALQIRLPEMPPSGLPWTIATTRREDREIVVLHKRCMAGDPDHPV